MEQFLISLKVYLRWVYDDRFGTLLGPVGTRVTLGPLGSPLGRMMGIDASEVPPIRKKYKKCTFFNGFKKFIKAQFKCIQHVYQLYAKWITDLFETYVRGISVV